MNQSIKTTRILVVDDHPAIRETMTDILTEEGFFSDFAADGIKALEKCLTEEFDFVLIDIQMPEMNGVEVLRELKEKRNKIPKFIFFTAYSTPELRQQALSLGSYAFLKKPIKVEKILNLIREKSGLAILIQLSDDHQISCITKLLSDQGYMVTQTKKHDEALIQLRQIDYNCIVFDSDSPGINQDSIRSTIKSLKSDTLCIETNEDETPKNLFSRISFHLDRSLKVLN